MSFYDDLIAKFDHRAWDTNAKKTIQSSLRRACQYLRNRWTRMNNIIALRRAVGDLDDHMLRDIGMEGSDQVAELKRRKDLEAIWRKAPPW